VTVIRTILALINSLLGLVAAVLTSGIGLLIGALTIVLVAAVVGVGGVGGLGVIRAVRKRKDDK
jgi:hypothetical protein